MDKRNARRNQLTPMNTTKEQDERIAKLTFASIYPHYVNKIVKKGRTIDELHHIISWLTGFSENEIQEQIEKKSTFEEFFNQANLPKNAELIKGSICGYKIQEISTPLTKKVRYLDKIVDELAKGKKLEKIIR